MFEKFITRPVLATVISIVLLILGIVGMGRLPVTQFPDIAPPSVVVTAMYPGASAETIARSVAPSLEEAINGVENMTYMTSTSGNDGMLTITVYFKLGTEADQAAVNVQNRVSQAQSQLPSAVIERGITTVKQQNSMIMVISLISESPNYDETFLQNYAKINLIPDIKRVPGVGQATVFGNKDYSMRIWLKPQLLASYNLTPAEVASAIQSQNIEAAPGKFGEGSPEAMEFIIKYRGKFNTAEDFGNIVIRSGSDGLQLLLRDVARIELGSYDYTVNSKVDGRPAVTMAIYQAAGSNANAIQTELQKVLDKASASFPEGISHAVPYSTKKSLDESIEQVLHTLLEAFALVFLVVFIFLQDFRSTLIPALAVPVAIVGTFFFMNLFGFSINLLTLFALVLAIGIVVDDAIVVVEAVHAKMEHRGLAAIPATASAMSEITGAIISITLVMSSVFLPVGFMEGPTGVFYRQFAFTLATAILISAVNALTLSPALCALFLAPHEKSGGKKLIAFSGFGKRFFSGFNAAFKTLTDKYVRSLRFLIDHKWMSIGALCAVTAVTFFLFRTTPTGFIPDEDNGFAMITVTLPPGASLERTNMVLKEADALLHREESVERVIAVSGVNIISGANSPSAGIMFVQLREIAERGKVKNIHAITGMMNQKLASLTDASFYVLTLPTVPGFGNVSGVEFVLQDRTAGSLQKFGDTANGFIGALMQRPEFAFAFTPFNTGYPQYELVVDANRAEQLGVSTADIMTVMQGLYGGMQASDFNRFGRYYRVIMQSEAADRSAPSSLNGVSVKNRSGSMVPLTSVASLKRVYGPETVDHFNLFNAIGITANVKPGYSTGQAITAIEEVSGEMLPAGYSYDWKGMSREETESGGKAAAIFALCLAFVYFLLAAQFESYILPLAVMLSIPTGLLGVFLGIKLAGIDNNIYVQVAIVMLIGLLAKNAILIVEYSIQRRRAGKDLVLAALEGSRARLRPILMTSFAFVVGLLPLLWASGPSALGNHSIGWAAVGGMLSGVLLGIFIIPVLFVIFQTLQERISGPAHPIEVAHAPMFDDADDTPDF
ncbi:MAG: efflux RND transporter permease subunit [Chlorobium sp.]|uniref:efflux RND transporter permease subunit n=1 Tax=Chlorobium sp. TaxID=1095 RepID=UPI0025BE632B|nr:efflux RND transporter permease subunit [Chlorobium sp.]MCF8216254.1 efflux RND transporter permease subunit [Chlorobium sp.]MCF8271156.1 efflux RND transporter permease subunit [Chlorobium sp.]MCF8287530.1 efflux RND transporter permease subunit [Chlorobium sp.]MCF8291069.1 efflux RND transporter permease subunit [Chlorobium sp.]MCF8385164.1 efflux RND transporter permease subunit [Chlorobium sp.]